MTLCVQTQSATALSRLVVWPFRTLIVSPTVRLAVRVPPQTAGRKSSTALALAEALERLVQALLLSGVGA